MKTKVFRFFARFCWVLLFLYAVKPAVAFLTYLIPTCFINCNVCAASLYKFFGAPIVGFALIVVCALIIAAGIGVPLLAAKKRRWRALGLLLMILVLPFQFSKTSILTNLCFGVEDDVTICEGRIAGKKIQSVPNKHIVAVRQKDVGYPPYAIFNSFDIDGMSSDQVDGDYVVKAWLKNGARFRLSRILANHSSIGYLIIEGGEMHYVDSVEGGIQEDGMFFVVHCSKSEELADDAMFGSFTALIPDGCDLLGGDSVQDPDDQGDMVYRGRVLNLESFIKTKGIKNCGAMVIP